MTTDMMRNEAKVLRECADKIEALGGFGDHVENLRATAEKLAPERTYTEEEVRKAWIYSENVYSWKAFQRELRRNR